MGIPTPSHKELSHSEIVLPPTPSDVYETSDNCNSYGYYHCDSHKQQQKLLYISGHLRCTLKNKKQSIIYKINTQMANIPTSPNPTFREWVISSFLYSTIPTGISHDKTLSHFS